MYFIFLDVSAVGLHWIRQIPFIFCVWELQRGKVHIKAICDKEWICSAQLMKKLHCWGAGCAKNAALKRRGVLSEKEKPTLYFQNSFHFLFFLI